ncbi:MAG TPA: SpaH/EbpB family LPXTG-anchored major pilin [Actinomycetaceae bacterium]|nr:SpaH/EbpB family LPXTG-anchored major pilin [Actinomycetaceae bacterium]
MTIKTTPLGRLLAGVGAAALATVGLLGLGTAASAETDTGFEPPAAGVTGSLTIHKFEKGKGPGADPEDQNPLAGVEFSVQEIGTLVEQTCTPIDLATPAGWTLVSEAIDTFNTTGAVPAGFCNLGTAAKTTTGDDGSTPALTGLRGLYLVTETGPGPNLIADPAAPFLVTVPMPDAEISNTWDFSVDAYPKNVLDTFEPEKTVAGNNTGNTPLVPGAVVPWTVTVDVPAAAFSYNEIVVKDTPSAGHTFTAFGTVTLSDGTDTQTLVAGTKEPETGDYYVDGGTLTLTAQGRGKVNAIAVVAGKVATLTVNLTTTINANIDPGTFTNSADVTLNGNTTPTDVPKSHWGKIDVTKVIAGTTTTLAGAQFVIYLPSGDPVACQPYVAETTPIVAQGTSDDNGKFEKVLWIANAAADDSTVKSKDYCLVETAAPSNYLLDSTPRPFTLSTGNDNHTTAYSFPNTKPEGPDIPMTGAGGTMVMTIAGLALAGLGTGAMVVSRRRRVDA